MTERNEQVQPARETQKKAYERPRIQQMTEREILNSFQITQSMNTWWTSGIC